MTYEILHDINNQLLKPGDYISVPKYPQGFVCGWVVISEKWRLPDGTRALSLKCADGSVYTLSDCAAKLLKVQKEMPEELTQKSS